jgi:hypothetical protein
MLRREFHDDVEMIHGNYGEFKVLVDGVLVVDAGLPAVLGVVPSGKAIRAAVASALERQRPAADHSAPGA